MKPSVRTVLDVLPKARLVELGRHFSVGVSGASTRERNSLTAFLEDLSFHPTPLTHGQPVGALRAQLRKKSLSVSTPDAHVSQCAFESGGLLWSNDSIFGAIERVMKLRVFKVERTTSKP